MPSSKISSTTSDVENANTSTSMKQKNNNSLDNLTQDNDFNKTTMKSATSEEYLNKKISFIQNHINNLLIEITNLPEPWTYAVTEDGRVFFIK
jgi:hypothetical protein